jgi:hypothetical protein
MEFKKLAIPGMVVLAVIALVAAVLSIQTGHVHANISYPYVCDACAAVFDVSELKKDYPNNWRIPPGAPSDSVVICVRCDKGWARPAATCENCGTDFVLYLGDNRCPKCFPEAAEKVRKARGKDSLFKRP